MGGGTVGRLCRLKEKSIPEMMGDAWERKLWFWAPDTRAS
jgi:hypothetical protein